MALFVKVRFRYRISPTSEQQALLAREFGTARYAYNWALGQRTAAFGRGERMNYNQSSAAWSRHRHETVWALETSSIPPQQALRHLQTAFVNFFAKRARYPKFRKKAHAQSAEYTRSAFAYDPATRTLTFAKLGRMAVRWSRAFVSMPTTATITKSPSGRYHVTLCLDEPEPANFPKTGQSVGVDLGLNRLATLSTEERIANPKHLGKRLGKLARAQRTLSRRKKGSGRWHRARVRVARIQERVADARADRLHKVTLDLVQRFDLIAIEDLNVRGMVQNHSLARSLSDASFGMFRRFLEYKAEWYGKKVAVVDRFFPSSKLCSDCGYVREHLSLSVRAWACENCGESHDRDENAARNILAAGQVVSARGFGVSPKRTSVRGGSRSGSVKRQRVSR